jgi:hypothetical protein
MDCSPKMDFMKFDEKSGKASVTVPKLDKDVGVYCSIKQSTHDFYFEKKSFKLTLLGVPKSLCMIKN